MTVPIFIFPFRDFLSAESIEAVISQMNQFLLQWKSHEAPVKAEAWFEESHFLIVRVDPSLANPSGCSKDKLQHFIQGLTEKLCLPLASPQLFWLKIGYEIHGLTKLQIKNLWQNDLKAVGYLLFPTWLDSEHTYLELWGKPLEHFADMLKLTVENPIFHK